MPFGVDDALIIGGLISSWFGNKKKKNAEKKAKADAIAVDLANRTAAAQRQDKIDADTTSVANQTSAEVARTKMLRNSLAKALAGSLKDSSNQGLVDALTAGGNVNAIKYTAPPANVVDQPLPYADPTAGDTFNTIGSVLGGLGTAGAEQKMADSANATQQSIAEQLKNKLWKKKNAALPSGLPNVDEFGDN